MTSYSDKKVPSSHNVKSTTRAVKAKSNRNMTSHNTKPNNKIGPSSKTNKPTKVAKANGLHSRNRHQGRYNFKQLLQASPNLKP